ncbi:MAG: ATP-binding protein [Planctomycetes bacterium]|nr:ATP-binding protein [Planctomycetota bacterium]
MNEVNPDNEATFHTCVIQTDFRETKIPKDAIFAELIRNAYNEDSIFAIKLALEEALANAVKHGNQNNADKRVTVRYEVTPEKVTVIVRDEGPGFIPEKVPDCTCADRLSVPSGRGIMLMRAYMDEVYYRDQGREVYFTKRRSSPRMNMPPAAEPTIRRTIHFSGRVQGVGFRFSANSLARRFDVTGYVRNLPDGRVEIVAEGGKDEIDQFQEAVAEAMKVHIQHATLSDAPPTGEFRTFDIAH